MPEPILSGHHYSIWKARNGSFSVDYKDLNKALYELAYELYETKQKLVNQIALVVALEMDLKNASHNP